MQATTPNHVAIIPDGNRRWARKHGFTIFKGHSKGAENTENIFHAALDLKIPYLTFWGCSVSNLTGRSREEVKFLMKVFELHFKKLAASKQLREHGVRVRVLGRWEEFMSAGAKREIRKLIDATQSHNKYNMTFLMAYDGRDEMTAALSAIIKTKNRDPKAPVSAALIKDRLWTRDLPPVDLAIRTGGEPHWSAGFMMWDVAEARLYFTETLWPAFTPGEFKKAVDIYKRSERRFGN